MESFGSNSRRFMEDEFIAVDVVVGVGVDIT